MIRKTTLLLTIFVIFVLSACNGESKKEFWVYTSIYRDIIEQLEPVIKQEFPELNIQWYKAGSEEVATRVNSEILAGGTQADIIMTSDPFWYNYLKQKEFLLQYDSPNSKGIPDNLKDPDNYFTTVRLSTMVMTYNQEVLKKGEGPKSFKSLTDSTWSKKVAMPDPLKSGTTFTTVAFLSDRYGWDYFTQLKQNGIVSSGGNSAVMRSVESKEYPIGVVLLENILKGKKNNSPADIIYPEDGAVLIPGPIAILKSTKQPEVAKKLYDFMLSRKGQQAIIDGYMHSPKVDMSPPEGAKPLKELLPKAFPWSAGFMNKITKSQSKVKDQYSKVMLN